MAVEYLTQVWKHSRHKGGDLLTLLAIADNTSEDTGLAFPSIDTLAKKTRMTPRGVQKSLRRLEQSQELTIKPYGGPYGTHAYYINLTLYQARQDGGEQRSGGVNNVQGDEQRSPEALQTPPTPCISRDRGHRQEGVNNVQGVNSTSSNTTRSSPKPLFNHRSLSTERDQKHTSRSQTSARPRYASEAFQAFWQRYPKKTEKAEAWHVWETANLDAQADTILAAVEQQLAHADTVLTAAYRFIPSPRKWLFRARWEDGLPPPTNGVLSPTGERNAHVMQRLIVKHQQGGYVHDAC